MSALPVSAFRPESVYSAASIASTPSPSSRARNPKAPGSTSPDRVPITSPSSGVRPMEVSMLRPRLMAQTDAPLPRWQDTICNRSTGWPITSAARRATYLCDVP